MSSPAPFQVSPIIKLGRYALLTAGIFYGMGKHATLSVVERNRRERQDALFREREPILHRQKKMLEKEEIKIFTDIFFPEDLSPDEKEQCKCKD